jgi:predicted TIM-barrel fold metal-dependent hydrolase
MSSTDVTRRDFLAGLAAAPLAAQSALTPPTPPPFPIIDTHIHLYDKYRGSVYPGPGDTAPGLVAYPPRYLATIQGSGIVGTVVTEASHVPEETQWILDMAEKNPIIVGHSGFLVFGTPDFGKHFDAFRKSRFFLGVRYRNNVAPPFAEAIKRPEVLADFKAFADSGLVFEHTAHPRVLLDITDRAPYARVVVPHLPRVNLPADRKEAAEYRAALKELGQRQQVSIKLSGVVKFIDGKAVSDVAVLKPWLDELWGIFGEDRVMFGSDWPHETRTRPFRTIMRVAREYMATKGRVAEEKVFWRNSARIYKWVRRDDSQPVA